MSLVLDTSIVLAWLLDDEEVAGDGSIFDQVKESGASVPSLWSLEIANALTVAVRRSRISQKHRTAFLEHLSKLGIVTDAHTGEHAWSATLQLADLYGLTVYDAAYLELAQRLRLPLATLDAALAKAAQSAGVTVLPAPGR